jgi:hypothetical protein
LLLEQSDAKAHQLVVVRLVACRARELGHADPFGKLDPDLGHEHAFEVETDHLHGAGSGRDGAAW